MFLSLSCRHFPDAVELKTLAVSFHETLPRTRSAKAGTEVRKPRKCTRTPHEAGCRRSADSHDSDFRCPSEAEKYSKTTSRDMTEALQSGVEVSAKIKPRARQMPPNTHNLTFCSQGVGES